MRKLAMPKNKPGNKNVTIGVGDYTEGDKAGGNINKNKNFHFSFSFFAVAALTVGGFSTIAIKMNWFQLVIQNFTGKVEAPKSPSNSNPATNLPGSSAPIPPFDPLVAPSPSPKPSYASPSKVTFPCGQAVDLSGVEGLATCPKDDADKDGRPDKNYASLNFTNKTNEAQSITFKKTPYPVTGNSEYENFLSNSDASKLNVPLYAFAEGYMLLDGGEFKGSSTVELKPGQSFALVAFPLDSFISYFNVDVGSGEPSFAMKELSTASFKGVRFDIDSPIQTAYGANAKMYCREICFISLSSTSPVERAFRVKTKQNGLDWTFIGRLSGEGQLGSIPLLFRKEPYEVTYAIP
jgi:hypothetical protein